VTIQDLGSLGELIAAVATVATLAYLAVQIRQNTSTIRSAALQTHIQNIQHVTDAIATSTETASVWQRGMADYDGLSPAEQAQFASIILGVFNSANVAHTNNRNGLLPDEEWRREWGVLRFYLRSNGGQRVWKIARSLNSLTSSFIEFAESELINRDS
jgi:hypothetical protein